MTKPTKKERPESEGAGVRIVVSEVMLRGAAIDYAAVADLDPSHPRWRRHWRKLEHHVLPSPKISSTIAFTNTTAVVEPTPMVETECVQCGTRLRSLTERRGDGRLVVKVLPRCATCRDEVDVITASKALEKREAPVLHLGRPSLRLVKP